MIELPEAVTIAAQMDGVLQGRRIAEAVRGNAPHKFAFYNHEPEEYAAMLGGKTIGHTAAEGGFIITELEPGLTLFLGGGGERILLHLNASTLPKKHQFLLRFTDGAYLSVTVQMWGMISFTPRGERPQLACFKDRPSPLSPDFTLEYFRGLFATLPPGDKRAIKYFLISEPGISGLGNGYTHDICFRSRLHHRRRAVDLSTAEIDLLHESVRGTLDKATRLGGRDSELDLFGCPGRYHRILDSSSVGQPCPECGTLIQKENFLGGASYFCPRCQA